MGVPSGIGELLQQLRTDEPSSPRLIWYGPGSERIELSGRVLDNWIAKTSNLLVDELDAEPGMRVELRLPTHWKTIVWAAACWQTGAVAVTGTVPDTGAADIVVSDDANGPTDALTLVLVAMGALEMRWNGNLPAGALDYAAEVRAHGDVFADVPAENRNAPVLETTDGTATFGDLLTDTVLAGHGQEESERLVVLAGADVPLRQILAAALQCWAAGGTMILLHPDVGASDQLSSSEKVTVQLRS